MIKFGSRGSDLALRQSRMVAAALTEATGEAVEIEVIETRGDRILDKPLPQIGGKGLFTEELENALRERRIDAAVHSMKDLPVCDPDGLTIGAVPERVAPHDVLICRPDAIVGSSDEVPLRAGSRVGTSSHRRRSALERLRPDLEFADIRGNVPTRVDKVRRGDYDAVVLAAAGLDRLNLALKSLERYQLPVSWSTPAPSQGALAVQCRADDERVLQLLARLHDPVAALCANAERDVLFRLGGGCSMPLGVLVTPEDEAMRLQAAFYTNPEHGLADAHAVFADMRGSDAMVMAAQLAEQWRPMVEAPLRGAEIVMLRPAGHSGSLNPIFSAIPLFSQPSPSPGKKELAASAVASGKGPPGGAGSDSSDGDVKMEENSNGSAATRKGNGAGAGASPAPSNASSPNKTRLYCVSNPVTCSQFWPTSNPA